MRALVWPGLVVCISLCMAVVVGAQAPVGALAIDERQGDQYGWAVDYETASAAQERALQECGSGCSVVLTFGRCAAYAADQDAASTAVGWAESFDSAAGARQAALSECSSRGGGSGCTVRVWGCNGPVVEEELGLNHVVRRQIQQGLQAEGFDPGGADRSVRSADAGSDSELAVGARRTVERVSGRLSGRGVAQPGRIPPASGIRERCSCEFRRTRSRVLAVDPEQHEPGGVQGVSGAVSERGVPGTGAGPAGGAGWFGGWCRYGNWTGRRRDRDIDFWNTGHRGACLVVRTSLAAAARHPAGMAVRAVQTCTGKPAGAACWMEISQQPGCHVWNPGLALGATVTWTGACAGSFAQGTGTLTWVWDGNRQTATGRLQDGKRNSHWAFRYPNGTVAEGRWWMTNEMATGLPATQAGASTKDRM